jgi:hypothetical protein
LLALAALASLVAGEPDRLPGAALGSVVVLHAERALGLFAASLLVLLVVVRAFEGELPSELSGRGVKYASRDGVEALRSELTNTLDELRTAQEAQAEAIESLDSRLADVESTG